MSTDAIDQQLKVVKEISNEAGKSKEAAIHLLQAAGLVNCSQSQTSQNQLTQTPQ